jgi:hypothetical protein
MGKLLPLWTIIGVIGCAQVVADEPAATATTATPVTTASPAAAAPATKTAADIQAAARIKRIRAQGYKPGGEQNGQTVWCRSETPMGSHIEKRTCRTADEIDATAEAGKDTVRDYQQKANSGPPSR